MKEEDRHTLGSVLTGFALSYTMFQLRRVATSMSTLLFDAVLAYRRLKYRVHIWRFERRHK